MNNYGNDRKFNQGLVFLSLAEKKSKPTLEMISIRCGGWFWSV